MNKKMICGILITSVGLVFSSLSFLFAVMNPCVYNGRGGLMGAFLGTGTLEIFIISTVVMCIGILICFVEAYRKD